MTSQVAEKASDLREQASSRARDELNSRSAQAAGQVTAVAQALRRTSGQLREEGTVTAGPTGRSGGAPSRARRHLPARGRRRPDAPRRRKFRQAANVARRRGWHGRRSGRLAAAQGIEQQTLRERWRRADGAPVRPPRLVRRASQRRRVRRRRASPVGTPPRASRSPPCQRNETETHSASSATTSSATGPSASCSAGSRARRQRSFAKSSSSPKPR